MAGRDQQESRELEGHNCSPMLQGVGAEVLGEGPHLHTSGGGGEAATSIAQSLRLYLLLALLEDISPLNKLAKGYSGMLGSACAILQLWQNETSHLSTDPVAMTDSLNLRQVT